MTAALVIVFMLTEGERAESPSLRTLSGTVYTCSLHAFSLVGQLSDREKPVLRIQNTFETNLNPIAQTTYV